MLRRILSNINDNFAQSLAGSAIIAISLFLWLDRTYFFWPPELTSTMNDQRVDIIIFILGVGLLISALFDNPNRVIEITLFLTSGAVIFVLALTQLCHGFLAGQRRMAYTAIGDLIIFILILRAAYKS